jgi:serine/threonine protein kinase
MAYDLPSDHSNTILTYSQSNIFITQDGQACLADFGLTVIGDMTLTRVQTTAELAGATRWLAPELLDPDVNISRKTPAGDVFAFGRLCLAVRTFLSSCIP